MAEPFIGQIIAVPYKVIPRGWLLCDGSSYQIEYYSPLYGVIGNFYGNPGNGLFNVPDLRGRTPIGWGWGPGLQDYVVGEAGGAEETALTSPFEVPIHTHAVACSTIPGNSASPLNAVFSAAHAADQMAMFSTTGGSQQMSAITAWNEGGSEPHANIQPYLAINFIISTYGLYPTRS